jgi:hypothetical protein
VLQKLVVEVLLGEIGIEGEQRTVFLRGVGERPFRSRVRGLVFADFLPGRVVVLLRGCFHPEHILHVRTVHIGLGEVRIEFYGLVVVGEGVPPAVHLNEVGGAVEIREDILRIYVYHPVHILESLPVIPDLGVDETAVVEGEGVSRLVCEHSVQILHRRIVVLRVIIQEGSVEVGESIRAIDGDGPVQVPDGIIAAVLLGIDAAAPYIALRVVGIQFYGLVVILHRLEGVPEEELGRSPVKVGGWIARIFPYVAVEVLNGEVELLGEEVGHAAAEVYAHKARAQLDGAVEVAEGLVVAAQAAVADGAVVIAVREDRIQPDGAVEVLLGSADVSEVVFGDAAEEEIPVVCGVQTRQDVEILDGLGVFPVGEAGPSPEEEHIPVVLGEHKAASIQKEYQEQY